MIASPWNRSPERKGRLASPAIALALSLVGVVAFGVPGPASAASEAETPKKVEWSFDGPFGSFDRAALQRGFQVYVEVCATCHGLQYITFGNLDDDGGPGFTEAEAKAVAAGYEKEVLDQYGDPVAAPRTLADPFPNPFANEQQARAGNMGTVPPDLSVITKARVHGPDYIYSLLTGYEEDAPEDVELAPGMSYNAFFPGHQIAMGQPLYEDSVTYADGTAATVEQMAHDVVTFLHWAAEPKLEARKRLGLGVMIYLVVLTGLLYWTYKRVWRDAH